MPMRVPLPVSVEGGTSVWGGGEYVHSWALRTAKGVKLADLCHGVCGQSVARVDSARVYTNRGRGIRNDALGLSIWKWVRPDGP